MNTLYVLKLVKVQVENIMLHFYVLKIVEHSHQLEEAVDN